MACFQMRDLEAELVTKEDRIQVLEGRFKELEAYRVQLQQQAALLASQQQQQPHNPHLTTNTLQQQFPPMMYQMSNNPSAAAGQLSPPLSPLNSVNHSLHGGPSMSPVHGSVWMQTNAASANGNAPPPYPGGPAR